MVQFNARAARIPNSNARLFTTGSTPGYPQSMTFVFVFGSAPKCAGDGENIFESVFNSTWHSKPIIVSKFMSLFLLIIVGGVSSNHLLVQMHTLLGKSFFLGSNFRLIEFRLVGLRL